MSQDVRGVVARDKGEAAGARDPAGVVVLVGVPTPELRIELL